MGATERAAMRAAIIAKIKMLTNRVGASGPGSVMMDLRTTVVAQAVIDGDDVPIAPASFASVSGYSDIFIDGTCVAKRVATGALHRRLAFFREFFAGSNITTVESESYGVNDEDIFVGKPQKFSHVSSHVSSELPLFDVHIDGTCVASSLSLEDAVSYIANSVNPIDVLGAIVDALVAPEFSFDDTLAAISKMSLHKFTGAQLVKRNNARNNAAQPTVSDYDGTDFHYDAWRRRSHKRVGKEKIYRSVETRMSGAPRDIDANYWVVLSRKDNEVLHRGSVHTARQYVEQYIARRGQYLRDVRVTRSTKMNDYIGSCDTVVRYNGKVVCIAPRAEAREFVADAISKGHFSQQFVRAETVR